MARRVRLGGGKKLLKEPKEEESREIPPWIRTLLPVGLPPLLIFGIILFLWLVLNWSLWKAISVTIGITISVGTPVFLLYSFKPWRSSFEKEGRCTAANNAQRATCRFFRPGPSGCLYYLEGRCRLGLR